MAYNNVVSIYLNPRNTAETKSYISRIIVTFEDMVNDIVRINDEIIKNLRNNNKISHINQIIYAKTLYYQKKNQFLVDIKCVDS